MTIEQLKKLRESEDQIEFKQAKHNYPFEGGKKPDPKDRRKCVLGYIVALANERGGILALGIKEGAPHEVVGSDFREGHIGELVDDVYERLGIRIVPEELEENGKRVLVIEVPSRPIGKLLKFEGVALMRTGESLREMSDAEMLKILSEQEPDFSEKICEGLTLDDLDEAAIEAMKEKYAKRQNNPAFRTIPTIQVLSDLGLLVEGKLKYAALILLGKESAIKRMLPQNTITVEYRLNHSMIPYTARKSFQQPLFLAVDMVWEYINQPASNPLQHYRVGPAIYDIPAFNEEAVREAILNSVCHRSLQIMSDVVIKQYPDQLTITNAGGFPLGVDKDNILTVNSVPRCKLMSDILEKTGWVERSGQGVDKMFYLSLMEGKELPSYAGTDDYQVSLTFRSEIKDPELLNFFRQEQDRRSEDNKLNVFDLLTLYYIRNKVKKELDEQIVAKLLEEGLLVHKKGGYDVNVRVEGNMPIKDYGKIRILKQTFISANQLTKQDIQTIFVNGMDERQVKYFISKLVANGYLVKVGSGRQTAYQKTELLDKME